MEPGAPTPPSSCWPLRDAPALIGALQAGQLDDDLTGLIDAINERTSTIAHNRTKAALARLRLSDRVQIGNRAKPQYLRGGTGTVHEIADDYVVVLLDRVVGKFTSRHLRCPPGMVGPASDT
jgi:hypothetical protein